MRRIITRHAFSLAFFLSLLNSTFAQNSGLNIGPIAGAGGSGSSGTVTSIATGCQATGGTITTSGTISTQLVTSRTVTSSATLAAGDACNQLLLNAATAQTLTLNNWASGNYGVVINEGAGIWTLSAGTGAINAGCSALAQNQSVSIQFDGTNWNIACGNGGAASVSNSDGTLTISPTTGAIVASLALAHANIWSANQAFTGTAFPSQAAGQTVVTGLIAAPSLTTTGGQAVLFTTAAAGANVQGFGSTSDVCLVNKAGSAAACVPTGTTGLAVTGNVTAQSSINQAFTTPGASAGITSRNASANAAATEVFEVGNNTSATEFTVTLNSSANTGGNGANSATVNGAATLFLQGASTNSFSLGASGAATIYNQPTTGTITYALCAAANANGATGGALILDTSVTVCGLSNMDYKRDIAAIDALGMTRLASLAPQDIRFFAPQPSTLDPMEILRLVPAEFKGDGKTLAYTKPELGIMAQDACEVDERICARFDDGRPRTPIPGALQALQIAFDKKLWAVIEQQQAEIDELRRELGARH